MERNRKFVIVYFKIGVFYFHPMICTNRNNLLYFLCRTVEIFLTNGTIQFINSMVARNALRECFKKKIEDTYRYKGVRKKIALSCPKWSKDFNGSLRNTQIGL